MSLGSPGAGSVGQLLWPAPTAAAVANILEYMGCNLVVRMAAGGYALLTPLRIKIILVFIIITSSVHSLVNQF